MRQSKNKQAVTPYLEIRTAFTLDSQENTLIQDDCRSKIKTQAFLLILYTRTGQRGHPKQNIRQITCKAKEIDEELWIYFDSSRISLLWLSLMSKTFVQRHSCLESWELNDCCSRVTLIFPIYGPDISSLSPSVQPTQRCTTVYITLWSVHSQLSTHVASSLSKAHVQFCQLLLTDFKK